VNDNNEILGGYNPLEWKSNGIYGTTKDSFIFSFSKDKISNYILSRVTNGNNSVMKNISVLNLVKMILLYGVTYLKN
jgi:hypothetical protein